MKNAWISPTGEITEVAVPGTHFRIAEIICKNKGWFPSVQTLDQMKYIRLVTDLAGHTQVLSSLLRECIPTQAQINTLWNMNIKL